MEIPYTISTRPDTGLWNAKIGIWLFLASEVMLFGGLFSAYVFLRLDAEPGAWPHGLLNVPVGTMNTAILIASSVTVVMAWASLKMRRYRAYWWYMLVTIVCGVIFLAVKLIYEWPQKFEHFGAYLKKEALVKYEPYLGNARLAENLQQARDLTPTSALAPAKNRGRPLGYPGTVRRFNFFRMAIKIPYVILCLARASSYAAPCLRLARFLGAVPVIAT